MIHIITSPIITAPTSIYTPSKYHGSSKGPAVRAERSINDGPIINRYNNNKDTMNPPKKTMVLIRDLALGVLNVLVSTRFPSK